MSSTISSPVSGICAKLKNMTKLVELISTASRVLRVPERTVKETARHLRENRLIRTGGRGPGGAEMGPTDTTNLLLGLMASDMIKDAPRCATLAREATFIHAEINHRGDSIDDPPPYSFMKDDNRPLPLGEALDRLFDEIVRFGDPKTDDGLPITNFSLQVHRPGLFAAMSLDDGGTYHTARYQRQDPRFDNLKGEVLKEAARQIFRKQHSSMKTITEIGFEGVLSGTVRPCHP